VNDSTGSRYRKIGLNGLPLSDGKPQEQDESGQPPEETYLDAFSLQLRHAVTDVYAEASGSLLPLMVRRDVSEETWSAESLETPDTRPHLPFGPGWSSNLCSYVKFETECVSRDNTVNINNLFKRHTFRAFPLSFLRNIFSIALMTVDAVAFWALLWLENYKLAEVAHKMIHC
jgi:hypothetical protein